MNKQTNWIFFDLDGTLLDNFDTLYEAYIDFLSEFNIKSNRKEFNKLNGPSIPEIVCILKDKYKLNGDENNLIQIYLNQIDNVYKNNIKPVANANYILEKLSKNYKLALVTSSSHKIAFELIKQQGWGKYFQDYVFGDEVKYSKPNPQIYELALKRTAAVPDEAIVVEDSINGIKSAKQAKIFTVGFANNQPEEKLFKAGADKTITKLKDIVAILENKNNHEIIVTGDIHLKEVRNNLQTEKLIDKNKDLIKNTWEDALKNKKMFNGKLLNFCEINKNENQINISGNFIEYKNFFAQLHKDINLNIKPVGVSGITLIKETDTEYLIFAKRANDVTQYPNFFELVPSGSIDEECIDANGNINYKSKLLSEFIEETGLSKELVKDISSFTLILDKNHGVYDIGCKIILNTKIEIVEEKFKNSKEYNNPAFVAINELDDFVKKHSDSIVPTSIALIEAYKRGVTYQ